MIFNQTTIILCLEVILMAIVTPFVNPFFRFRKAKPTPSVDVENNEQTEELTESEEESQSEVVDINEQKANKPITVLITAHNNAQELERHLPQFLSQNYEPGYEVIVVAEKGDGETEDVLKRHIADKHLYYTFIPDSSKYMSRKKLAITLGVKAARNEWIVLTDACCAPFSDKWLKTIANHCDDDKNLLIGYSNYDNEAKPYYRFERLQTMCYLLPKAMHSTAYRTNGNLVAFRKSEFIDQDGYRGNLETIRGEYDFLVNKYARKGDTEVMLDQDGWVIEDAPTQKTWRNKQMFYMHTRKHLQRKFCMRSLFNIDNLLLHLNYLLELAALAYSIIVQNWILTVAAVLAFIITITLRSIFGKKVMNHFDEDISVWRIVPYEISTIWHKLAHRIRYWRADKYDFTSHKL
ncbi:MAG: glycosyltransferase [Prevotella sp.]|nr:glycosyltransferase [Prevotella sp.]